MNITARDQTNKFRSITFRAPDEAITKALANYDGYSWRVSRSTALRLSRAAYRLVVSTEDEPLQVFIQQNGPYENDFFITLKP